MIMKFNGFEGNLAYQVRHLNERDIPKILTLYRSNPQYDRHFPPDPSDVSVKNDLNRRPDGSLREHKHYLGFGMKQS